LLVALNLLLLSLKLLRAILLLGLEGRDARLQRGVGLLAVQCVDRSLERLLLTLEGGCQRAFVALVSSDLRPQAATMAGGMAWA